MKLLPFQYFSRLHYTKCEKKVLFFEQITFFLFAFLLIKPLAVSRKDLGKNSNWPKIEKIILNMGLGLDGNDSKILKSCEEDLAKITGQKPVVTKFKKSVANFKTRKGSNAGLKVTLRKNKMYEFLDRLVNIALPRIKDFRGLSSSGFDKFGNYTFGVKEHIIFPEVTFDRADKVRGIDIIIVISSKNKDHSFALLEKLNFPFIKKGDN